MSDDFQAAKELRDSYAAMLEKSDYWVHSKSGGTYLSFGVALEEATLTPVVLYQGIGDSAGPTWTRPAFEFFDRFEAKM